MTLPSLGPYLVAFAIGGPLVPILFAVSTPGCTAAQGAAVEKAAVKGAVTVGCLLVSILVDQEEVGQLCQDIAPVVQQKILDLLATQLHVDRSLLAHHAHRRHGKRVRLHDHAPRRDPAETIDEAYVDVVRAVLEGRGETWTAGAVDGGAP